jgi:transcriptional regulator with XRE-family HTH domain
MKGSRIPAFTGEFTPVFRALLRRRIQEADCNYSQIAEILKVSPGTVKKWQNGEIRQCQERHVARVDAFLRSNTAAIREDDDFCREVLASLPFELTTLLGNATLIYERTGRKAAAEKFAAELDGLARNCLLKLQNFC